MILWIGVAIVSIFATPFVTGSDPTSLPLTSLIVSVFGSFITGSLWFLIKPTYYI